MQNINSNQFSERQFIDEHQRDQIRSKLSSSKLSQEMLRFCQSVTKTTTTSPTPVATAITTSNLNKQTILPFSISRLLQSNEIESTVSKSSFTLQDSPYLFDKLLSNFSKLCGTTENNEKTSVSPSESLLTSYSWINTPLLRPGVASGKFVTKIVLICSNMVDMIVCIICQYKYFY